MRQTEKIWPDAGVHAQTHTRSHPHGTARRLQEDECAHVQLHPLLAIRNCPESDDEPLDERTTLFKKEQTMEGNLLLSSQLT
jgi:hypothetical protein